MTVDCSKMHLCIVGSRDFVHRMSAAARRAPSDTHNYCVTFSTGCLAEARALVIAERPHVLLVDIGFNTSKEDAEWLKGLLLQIRERFGKKIYIIIAITTPQKFALGGTLFFRDEVSLDPSGLVDNLIIAPPPGIPSIMSLENQLRNCLDHVQALIEKSPDGDYPLPTLWEDSWVPSMSDPASRDVWMRWLPRYAHYINENPLIVGPTGTGKTRLALAVHRLSGREGPFVSITPRDFSSSELVQAELFGAVQGAYTGAVDKWGLVKKADGGTLFIDELQSIDRDLQGKLITFIENKTYRRVGEAESHQADVRFVFATNLTVQELVETNCLREDFAYRLERLQINLLPLKERRLDIAAGMCFAMAKVLRERTQAIKRFGGFASVLEGLSLGAYSNLFCSSWPGNLRQVENTMARLIELADVDNKQLIDEECTAEAMGNLFGDFGVTPAELFERSALNVAKQAQAGKVKNLEHCLQTMAEHVRLLSLEHSGGNIEKAAEIIEDSVQAMKLFAASRNDR